MLYSEYLKCAAKHLKACNLFLASYQEDANTDFEVLNDIYYLTGYILEGLTIHSVYKLYQWNSYKDIDDRNFFDYEFYKKTHLDFFHFRSINNVQTFKPKLKVQGHGFQRIAQDLLQNQGPFTNDNITPYFGNGPINHDVKLLIDKWRPEVRYLHKNHRNINIYPTLTKGLLIELVKTCNTIFLQIINVIGI